MHIATTILTELTPVTLVLLVLIAIVVGMLIGSVGVGGILLVPALIYLAGIDIHIAIASSLFSYAFSGLMGAWVYAKQGSIRWASGLWLCAGAMPGAWLGATVVNKIAGDWVILIIAAFVIFAAINAILAERDNQSDPHRTVESRTHTEPMRFDTPIALFTIGVITGAGSALSGSGGPLILVPTLVYLKWPVLAAVGLGQVIQVPISLFADIANLQAGTIDLPLGLGIAVFVTAGVTLGARFAHRQPAALLRKTVIGALLFAAAWMIFQSGSRLLVGG